MHGQRLFKKSMLTFGTFILSLTLVCNGALAASASQGATAIFKDMTTTHWAAQSIGKLKDYGLISGYSDGSVKPDRPVTRAEFATIVNRLFGYPQPQQTSLAISDLSESSWAYKEIAKAVSAGYLKLGPNNEAKPNEPLSRAEVAVALSVIYHLASAAGDSSGSYNDIQGLDAASQAAIRSLTSAGFAKGYADGSFKPGKTITRAELAVLLDRMTALFVNEAKTVSAGTVHGNVVVNHTDAILKDTTVEGNLYLTPGLGEGNARLDHVKVSGTTFVQGGGEHSVTIDGSTLGVLHVDKANGTVRVVISGTVDRLIIDGLTHVVLAPGAVVKHLIVASDGGSSKIEGDGTIEHVDNQAAGVLLNGAPLLSTGTSPGGGSSTGSNGSGGTSDPWTLVWNDEFNDGTIDPTKWTYDLTNGQSVGNPGWGNNELEYYTDRPENVKEENGNLVITARKESYEGYDYTSARIKTKGLFSKTYGKYEIRAKTPVGKGYWPAIWMLPENYAYGTWAASGEIDIMETWGSRPDTIAGTLHYGQQWPGNTYTGKEYKMDNGTIDQFHTYSLEWEPNEIRWYVDGHLYATQNDWYSKSADQPANNAYPAPFDQQFHLLMNVAVGGNFDGNPTEDTVFPQQMQIDYVRVYELTGRPYAAPIPPTLAKENYLPGSNLPQAPDNDLVYNADFTQNVDGDAGMGIGGTAHWSLFKEPGADAASVAIETIGGKNFAKVSISNAGGNPYSIQPQAIVSLAKGRNYKLTFDAKTDTSRDMNVKLTGGASRGFAAYSPALAVPLTGDLQSYEMSFQMKQDSDVAARIEFNMGTNSHPVWIGNVKLVEIDTIAFDHDVKKVPFGVEGNHIYNGTFDQGEPTRLSYWHIGTSGSAQASATVDPSERKLRLNVTNGGTSADQVQVVQRGLSLINGQQYRLTLDASASAARDLAVQLRSNNGDDIYSSGTLHLSTSESPQTFSFTYAGATTEDAQLAILAGGATGSVKLDNIKLVRTSIYLDPSVAKFPLQNGQFDRGLAVWETFGLDGGTVTASADDSAAKLSIGAVGPNPWSIMLNQGNLSASAGVRYVVAFDAYATTNRKLEAVLENASFNRSFDQTVDLTTTKQRYAFEFTKGGSETVALKFLLGKLAGDPTLGAHDVYIDNIVFEPKASVELSNLVANGQFGSDIAGWTSFYGGGVTGSVYGADGHMVAELSGSGGDFWNVQADYKGITIEQNKSYRLTFDASASLSRNIQVVVEHAGEPYTPYLATRTLSLTTTPQTFSYTFTSTSATDAGAHINFLLGKVGDPIGDAHTVSFDNVSLVEVQLPPLVPPEGHAVLNGTFDTDTQSWSTYTGDGSNAAISVDGQKLKVRFSAYDGWFPWSTQVYQDHLKLESGKTYVLSFDASSSFDKPVSVEVGRSGGGTAHLAAHPIALTGATQTYTVEFTVTGDTDQNAKLNFLLGSNNVPGESFTPHSIWIDNVSLTEKAT
ncbi:carbohydrate binding domain-containing protein [Cohnella yongneupensis]|uniref:Carbohydrate binding domain-containing protein n=1 Tax=Cohnella yongneupensis TaxID=425006 RepID=A0ABW0QW99_9BACL